MKRIARYAAIACLLVVAVILGMGPLTRWRANRTCNLPIPTGQYHVGRRSFAFTDARRAAPFSADAAERRRLFVWVWYPADPAGMSPAPYLPPGWTSRLARDDREQRLDLIVPHAREGTPVDAAKASYPVLIFGPGYGQLPSAYTALAEEMASHGYFVIGVAHTLITPLVVFPDGEAVRWPPQLEEKSLRELVPILAADYSSTLDFIATEHVAGREFFAQMDVKRVGVFGHSLGGAAAAAACAHDGRFRAGADLDGSLYGDVVTAGISQPFQLLLADQGWPVPQRLRPTVKPYDPDHDHGTQHSDLFLAHSPEAQRILVARLDHMSFTDRSFTFVPADRLMELLGVQMSGSKTRAMTSEVLTRFFAQHLE